MGNLNMLVIHCTDTPPLREVTSAEVRFWHTAPPPAGRGWGQVGYADMIHLNGVVENLVPHDENQMVDPSEITNGAQGYNSNSRHVVYVGGMSASGSAQDTRTPLQSMALAGYVKKFLQLHPTCKVAGHNQLAAKACPSFDVPAWLRSIGINEINIYKK